MTPATAGQRLDRLIDSGQEMIRNLHEIVHLREGLLEHERAADKARLAIDKLTRRQIELATTQAGLRT